MKAKRLAAWLAQAWLALSLVAAGTAGRAQDQSGNKNMWGKDISIKPARGPGNHERGSDQMESRARQIAKMFDMHLSGVYVVGSNDNHAAIAELSSGGKRRIYYGRAFDSAFEDKPLESYVVLSHEMAHLVLGHIRDDTSTAAMELDADGLGACIVHALILEGPSQYTNRPGLKGTLADVKAIYDGKPSDRAHPSASVRQAQVQKGWDYATIADKTTSRVPCLGYLAEHALHRPTPPKLPR